MTTIDEIMAAAYAPSAATASGRSVCPRLAAAELRSLITQAIAEARADGAREMREAAASAGFDAAASDESACTVMEAIEALPLPTGPRQAVRLEDWQLAAAMSEIPPGDELAAGFSFLSWQSGRPDAASALDEARLVQAAVLAANGMGDGMGDGNG